MPEGNIQVKHKYSCAPVVALAALSHIQVVKNLRRIRQAQGLSQTQLADKAGVSQPTVSKLENGNLNATLENIYAIADALKVHPVQLFELPELQSRALSALGRIEADQLEAALVVLETMAGKSPAPAPARRPSR